MSSDSRPSFTCDNPDCLAPEEVKSVRAEYQPGDWFFVSHAGETMMYCSPADMVTVYAELPV